MNSDTVRISNQGIRRPAEAGLIGLSFLLFLLLSIVEVSIASAAGGDFLWQAGDLQSGLQMPNSFAVDGNGNVIVTGYRNLSGGVDDELYTVKFKQDGSGVAWSAPFNSSGGSDRATAVAVDSDNNVIVTGNVWNGQNYDIYVIKYKGTPSGASAEVIWSGTYAYPGSPGGNDFATSIAVDSFNNIYVGGYTNGGGNDDFLLVKWSADGVLESGWPIIYNAGSGHDRVTALAIGDDGIIAGGYSQNGNGDFDFLVRKYDFSRNAVWEKRHSSLGSFEDRVVAMKTDGAGNIIATGFFTDAAGKHISTIKLAKTTGDYLWALPRGEQVYKGDYDDEPNAIWVDAAGDVYVTGYTFTLAGKHDLYTAKYSGASGALMWQKIFNSGSDYTDIATGIVVDNAGDCFVTGYSGIEGNYDIQTIKYNKNTGAQLWVKRFNGSANRSDKAIGVTLSPARDVYVMGWSDKYTAGANDYDYYLLKYDYGRINPPTGLTAVPTSDTSISLKWADNAGNEEKFVIERKLGEGGTYAPITPEPGQDAQNHSDSAGLTANNYYYYRIRAYNATDGYSSYSNEVRVLTKVITYDTPPWIFGYGGANNNEDVATSVAIGADDHPVITGYSNLIESGTELDPEPSISFDYFTTKIDRGTKATMWEARYDSGSGGNDKAVCVAVDGNKDVIVTGSSFVLGTGAQMGDPYSDDLYTIKYKTYQGPGSTDTLSPPLTQWEMQYGSKDDLDRAVTVTSATDGSNNIAVVGFGKNNSNPGNDDIYIIKYTPAGVPAWTPKTYDSGRNDYPTAVTFDGAGDIFVTGFNENTTGNTDFFTAKYSGVTGNLIWSDTYANPMATGNARAQSIAVDKEGNAYVTGYVTNEQANRDFYTIKYAGAANPAKRRIWEKRYSGFGNGDDWGAAIKVDPIDGAVVAAGTSFATPSEPDFHIIRYRGADGEVVWERNLDRPGSYDYLSAMAIDSSGYIYVAGNTRTGSQGDAGYDDSSDTLSVIWDFEGTFLSAMIYDGAGKKDEARSIAVNYQGEAFIAGLKRNPAGDADFALYKHKNNYILVPAPLTVVPQADFSKVNFTWRENTPSTSFRLERTLGPANDASAWETIGTFASGTLSFQDMGRSAGTNYCYRINAFTGSLNSRKIETCITTTLQAPVLNPLTVDSTSQITLSWNSVTDSTGYRIERKIGSGGSWNFLINKSAGETTHQDSSLAPGTTCYYRVSTNSPSGYSVTSNERNAITKPAPPTLNIPSDSNITKNQVILSWNSVTGAATYTLQYKPEGGSWADAPNCTAITGTSCTVTSLVDDTLYHFQGKAANTGGDSSWSSYITAYTKLIEPAQLAATPVSTTQINITWSDNTDKETGYVLEEATCFDSNNNPANCGINGWWTGWTTITGLTGAAQPYQRTGRSVGTAHKYRLRAVNAGHANNYSAYSNEVVNWTWLNAPVMSSIEPISQTSLKVNWTDISGENRYTLERKQTVNGTWADVPAASNLSANTLTYTDGALLEQTEYCYRIKATNTYNGKSVYSSNEYCKMTSLASPNLTAVTPLSTNQIRIDWTSVAGANGYEIQRAYGQQPDYPGTDYYYDWTTLPKIDADPLEPAGTAHSFTDTVPLVGYTYRYRIRDTYGAGDVSGWSVTPYKYATTVPAAPMMNTPTANSTTQLTPSWGNVYGETGYWLEWKERVGTDCTAGTWSGPILVSQNYTYFSHVGLTQATWYCYRVRAANSLHSDYSNIAAQMTLLPAPTLNNPSGVTIAKIDLSWNDIDGNTGYDVYRSTDGGVNYYYRGSAPQNQAYYSDTGLSSGTLYFYRVHAKNAGGLSAASNIKSATTTPAATTVTLNVVSPWQINLSWPVRQGATNYKIDRKESSGSYTEIDNVAASYELLYCGSKYPTTTCQSLSDKVVTYSAAQLNANTSYCFRVRAWNDTGGDSVSSTEKCMSTLKIATPALSVSPISATSIGITATYDASACGIVSCIDIDGFELEVKLNGNWIKLATLLGTTSATYTDRVGVGPNSQYVYRARAFKGPDFSTYTEAVVSTSSLTAAPPTCP